MRATHLPRNGTTFSSITTRRTIGLAHVSKHRESTARYPTWSVEPPACKCDKHCPTNSGSKCSVSGRANTRESVTAEQCHWAAWLKAAVQKLITAGTRGAAPLSAMHTVKGSSANGVVIITLSQSRNTCCVFHFFSSLSARACQATHSTHSTSDGMHLTVESSEHDAQPATLLSYQ